MNDTYLKGYGSCLPVFENHISGAGPLHYQKSRFYEETVRWWGPDYRCLWLGPGKGRGWKPRSRSPFIPEEESTDDDGSLIGFQSGVFENYNAPIGLDFYRMPG